nr:unnamed protein product [Callosobruchus chinensis]
MQSREDSSVTRP